MRFRQGTALIMDVGSTKAAICDKAERRGLNFVGGHPMAGLEQSGPDAADAALFKDAPFLPLHYSLNSFRCDRQDDGSHCRHRRQFPT